MLYSFGNELALVLYKEPEPPLLSKAKSSESPTGLKEGAVSTSHNSEDMEIDD